MKTKPLPIQSALPGRPPGRLIGYARVSTTDQDTALQLDALERAGCAIIEREQGVSGTVAAANRPVLGKLLNELKPGDTLVVWRLDRLGRSSIDLEQTITWLKDRGIGFKSVCDSWLDTTTAAGKMMFQVMSSFAEFERNLIAERTKAGLAAVRERGQKLGPAFKLTEADVKMAEQMIAQGMSPKKIAAQFGVGYHTLWRAIKRLRADEATREWATGALPLILGQRDDGVDMTPSVHEQGLAAEYERFEAGVQTPHAHDPSDAPNCETCIEADIHSACEEGQNSENEHFMHEPGEDPDCESCVEDTVQALNGQPVRDQMIDKLVNDTSMHAHWCECNMCLLEAKEET